MRLRTVDVACPLASVEAQSGGWVYVKPAVWVLSCPGQPALSLCSVAALHPASSLAQGLMLLAKQPT